MNTYKQVILDNQKLIKNIQTLTRDYEFYNDLLKLNKIVSFVGPRRVGKTFLMIDFVKRLIQTNSIELEQVVFIDFSLYSNEEMNPLDILREFKEIYPNKEPFFIFDEIQDIANFKEFVLTLYLQGYKIFLSGSNSKLLSSELSTHFRGRVFEYKVFPLTFKEVLRFKNMEYKNTYSTVEMALINNIFAEILEFGSFPEIILSKNDLFKIDNLKTYLDVLIYKDVIERYKIDNEVSLKYMIKSITYSFTKNININKIYNELKSLNIKVGKTTLYEYYEYLKSVFYIFELENYYNPKASKKVFLYNLGFNKILGNKENLGQSFENIVFLELLKRYEKIYFKENGSEIDFFIPEIETNFQVCFDLSTTNFKRETRVFKNINEKNIIIYFSKNGPFTTSEHFEGVQFMDFIAHF